jgi:hypothetical protein
MKKLKLAGIFIFLIFLAALGVIMALNTTFNLYDPNGVDGTCNLNLNGNTQKEHLGQWIGQTIMLINDPKTMFNDRFIIYPPINRTTGEPEGWKAYLAYWPEKFNLTVPCSIGGFTTYIVSDSNKSGNSYYWPDLGSETLPVHQRKCWPQARELELPPGKVYFAIQYIPMTNATWKLSVLTPVKEWTDFKDYNLFSEALVELNAACTCSIERVIGRFDTFVKVKGFEETEPWATPRENECFNPLSVKLYHNGDQYLYVEFSEVKDMDLDRVLMIMGDEETVKAYAKAFTAGNIEG